MKFKLIFVLCLLLFYMLSQAEANMGDDFWNEVPENIQNPPNNYDDGYGNGYGNGNRRRSKKRISIFGFDENKNFKKGNRRERQNQREFWNEVSPDVGNPSNRDAFSSNSFNEATNSVGNSLYGDDNSNGNYDSNNINYDSNNGYQNDQDDSNNQQDDNTTNGKNIFFLMFNKLTKFFFYSKKRF